VIKKMGHRWNLRQLMAGRDMFQTSDLGRCPSSGRRHREGGARGGGADPGAWCGAVPRKAVWAHGHPPGCADLR
jgi:hypothetical protein